MLSKNILSDFLLKNNISLEILDLIKKEINQIYSIFEDREINNFHNMIVYMILLDLHNLNSQDTKKVVDIFEKKTKIILGREEKEIIKYILDYNDYSKINKIDKSDELKKVISEIYSEKYHIVKDIFIENFNNSDVKRKKEILLSIFLRIFHKVELSKICLVDIYLINEKLILKELGIENKKIIKDKCEKNNITDEISIVSKKFNEIYLETIKNIFQNESKKLLLEDFLNNSFFDENIINCDYILNQGNSMLNFPTEEYDLINMIINQKLYDLFYQEELFYDYILKCISESYRILKNYKYFQ